MKGGNYDHHISWYQEMAGGYTRKGKGNFTLFGSAGLGDVNALHIKIYDRRLNLSINLKEIRASRIEEMTGSYKETIGVVLQGEISEDKDVCWWFDEKEIFLFETKDKATKKSFLDNEKALLKKGRIKITVDFKNNRVKVCQL